MFQSKALSKTGNHVSCQECLLRREVTSLFFHLLLLKWTTWKFLPCFPFNASFFLKRLTTDTRHASFAYHLKQLSCFLRHWLFSSSWQSKNPSLLFIVLLDSCYFLFMSRIQELSLKFELQTFSIKKKYWALPDKSIFISFYTFFCRKEEERREKKKTGDKQDIEKREQFLKESISKAWKKSLKGLRIWAVSVFYWWTHKKRRQVENKLKTQFLYNFYDTWSAVIKEWRAEFTSADVSLLFLQRICCGWSSSETISFLTFLLSSSKRQFNVSLVSTPSPVV